MTDPFTFDPLKMTWKTDRDDQGRPFLTVCYRVPGVSDIGMTHYLDERVLADPLQLAGVVALMLEKNPSLTPAEIKKKLMDSARDIKTGSTGTGETAGPGVDGATGAGLVDAKWAYLITMSDLAGEFMSAPPKRQRQMFDEGLMPRLPKELIADMIDTLRSR